MGATPRAMLPLTYVGLTSNNLDHPNLVMIRVTVPSVFSFEGPPVAGPTEAYMERKNGTHRNEHVLQYRILYLNSSLVSRAQVSSEPARVVRLPLRRINAERKAGGDMGKV